MTVELGLHDRVGEEQEVDTPAGGFCKRAMFHRQGAPSI